MSDRKNFMNIKRALTLAITGVAVAVPMSVAGSVGTAGAAYADNCEPTEPVVRQVRPTYEEPFSEDDAPACYVLLNYVYPRLCNTPDPLLTGCLNSLNPRPLTPVTFQPFNPDPDRIACDFTSFVITDLLGQTTACASASSTASAPIVSTP